MTSERAIWVLDSWVTAATEGTRAYLLGMSTAGDTNFGVVLCTKRDGVQNTELAGEGEGPDAARAEAAEFILDGKSRL